MSFLLRNKANPGRAYDGSCDLSTVLSSHFNPKAAIKKINKVRDLLSSKSKKLTVEERKEKGWEEAYDLRPWNKYSDTKVIISNLLLVLVQNNFIG